MIHKDVIQIWEGIYIPRKKRWYDRNIGNIYPERIDNETNYRFTEVLKTYIRVCGRNVMMDKKQRRLMIQVVYTGDFGFNTIKRQYLVVRMVHNPDKLYKQLSGVYKYGDRRIPVIGRQVLTGEYDIRWLK